MFLAGMRLVHAADRARAGAVTSGVAAAVAQTSLLPPARCWLSHRSAAASKCLCIAPAVIQGAQAGGLGP